MLYSSSGDEHKNLFSLDYNTADFNSLTAFQHISKIDEIDSSRIIKSDIEHDLALSIIYNRLSDIGELEDAYTLMTDKFKSNFINLSSSTSFSFPTGFEVHHCAISSNGTNFLDSRSNYSPDKIQQQTIVNMYKQLIEPTEVGQSTQSVMDLDEADAFTNIVNSTYEKINVKELIPKTLNYIDKYAVINSGDVQTILLEFASILEKLKQIKCNCYGKQTVFDGKMLLHNTINVYPELPAVSDSSTNSYYSAVLASPLAKYYNVDIEQSEFLKRIFSLDIAQNVNQIASNQLIYAGFDYKSYTAFALDTFDGTNGKAEMFINISTSTYDLKSQIPDILTMFSLTGGNVMSLKKTRQALLYILDLWQRNIQTFQIDIYACHFNCHLNNLIDPVVEDATIKNYYYTIIHEIKANTFPSGLRDTVSFSGHMTSYKFTPVPTTEGIIGSDLTPRSSIVMSYPIYTGNDLNVQIPVKLDCFITDLYGDTTHANVKEINFSDLYYVTRNLKTESVYVQDKGLNNSGTVVPGKDIKSPIKALDFSDVNNTISCVGNIRFEFSYYSDKIIKNYVLENGNIKNKINITTDEKIAVGYIYDVRGNTKLNSKPDFINMNNRTVNGVLYEYATSYTPKLTHGTPFVDSGEVSIWFHYPSNTVHDPTDPAYYARLSNYISVIYETHGETRTAISSMQIADEDAWTSDGKLKPDVMQQFRCSYENYTTITDNAVITIIPVEYSEFGGSLTASYEIKSLPKISFNDAEKVTIDWDDMTKAVMDDYTQGVNGPFTPTVDVYEKSYDGDKWIDNEAYSIYQITYDNNNPTTYTTQTMTANILPLSENENGYGDVFYIGDTFQLTCSLKPMPSESSGHDAGDFQFCISDSGNHQITQVGRITLDKSNWWRYGACLDWDETADEKGGFGTTQLLTPTDDLNGWKRSEEASSRIFEYTTTIPGNVNFLTVKYSVSRPAKDNVAVVGSFAVTVNGQTVWLDIYNIRLSAYMKRGEYPLLSRFENSTTVKISPPEGSSTSTLGIKCSVLSPKASSMRFVSVSVWYTLEPDSEP